jgi:hypothetical protein
MGTVQEHRRNGKSAVGSRYQTIDEDRVDLEDLMRAIVYICEQLLLVAVASYKY